MLPTHAALRYLPLLTLVSGAILICFLSPRICDPILHEIVSRGYPDPSCALHYGLFFSVAFALNTAIAPEKRQALRTTLTVGLITILFSAVCETLQPLVGRHTELRDYVANTLGVMTYVALYRLCRHRSKQPPSNYSIAKQAVAAYRSHHKKS